ncbi:kinase-like protein [Penicillium verhagenii]|uniref:kinase-like protein n=1 Tax=Penicillium verhagenii TaxID=1562060 RepID=UPI002545182F|nr:kinase-like protein [Penicillium verhagenii]KAJ5935287.1 kinase-like protein [Penicillium verhagenii]
MVFPISEKIQTLPRTYKEDQGYQADDSEPCERSQNAKIGVTGRGGLLKGRKKLEALICLIDFRSIPLLPDTD